MEKIKYKDFYNIKSNPTRKRKLNEDEKTDNIEGIIEYIIRYLEGLRNQHQYQISNELINHLRKDIKKIASTAKPK